MRTTGAVVGTFGPREYEYEYKYKYEYEYEDYPARAFAVLAEALRMAVAFHSLFRIRISVRIASGLQEGVGLRQKAGSGLSNLSAEQDWVKPRPYRRSPPESHTALPGD